MKSVFCAAGGFSAGFMKLIFLFFAGFSLFSCLAPGGGPSLQAKPSGEFERPSCDGGPSAGELSRQKEDLFRSIESSGNYATSKLRDEAVRKYKRIIAAKEESSCPKDVERLIEGIAKLHEN